MCGKHFKIVEFNIFPNYDYCLMFDYSINLKFLMCTDDWHNIDRKFN